MSCWGRPRTSSNELATTSSTGPLTATAQYGYLVSTDADGTSASATLTEKESADSDNVYYVQSGTIFKLQKEPYTSPPSIFNESELAEQYSGVLASQAPVTLIPTYEKDNKMQYKAIIQEGTLLTLFLANNEGQKLFKAEKNDSLQYDPATKLFTVAPDDKKTCSTFVVSPAEPQLIVVLTYYFSQQISGRYSGLAIQTRLETRYQNEFGTNITVYVLVVPAAQTSPTTDRLIGLSVTIYNNTTVKPSDVQTELQLYFNSQGGSGYNVLPPPVV